MSVITIIIMVIAFIGMIVCAKVQKSKPQAKLLAALCLVVVLICAGKFMADTGAFGGDTAEVREQRASYARFSESTAKKIAEFINTNYAGEKIIIVAPGGADYAKMLTDASPAKQVMKYLKNSGNAEIKGLPVPAATTDDVMPGEMKAKYFNDLFDQNASVKLFVFAAELPMDPSELARIKIWGKKNGPKAIIMNLNDFRPFYNEIKNGVVPAAVMLRPDLQQKDYETLAPSDLDEAFKARYLFVDAKSLDTIVKKYFNKK